MKNKQHFPVARIFLYLNAKGEEVNQCPAGRQGEIESCYGYADCRNDVKYVILEDVMLKEQSIDKVIGVYVKFIN